MEYIYILVEREFIKTNENIGKIGMSKQENDKRISQYPNGSQLISLNAVKNSVDMETIIIIEFKRLYKHRTDIGNEYFEGDFLQMRNTIFDLIIKYDDNTTDHLKEFSRLQIEMKIKKKEKRLLEKQQIEIKKQQENEMKIQQRLLKKQEKDDKLFIAKTILETRKKTNKVKPNYDNDIIKDWFLMNYQKDNTYDNENNIPYTVPHLTITEIYNDFIQSKSFRDLSRKVVKKGFFTEYIHKLVDLNFKEREKAKINNVYIKKPYLFGWRKI